jgi:hypothetical protein
MFTIPLQFVEYCHDRRLALNIQLKGVSLASILKMLSRLQSLFLMHGFSPELDPSPYGDLSTYLPVAHLSVDNGMSLSTLLGVFPALQTLQLSPCRYISPGWPVHPTLRRLKLLSLSTSFGHAETRILALTFPGIKEFEARFERVGIDYLNSRWNHNTLVDFFHCAIRISTNLVIAPMARAYPGPPSLPFNSWLLFH